MDNLSSNSLSGNDWLLDQPADEDTVVDQSLTGGETMAGRDTAVDAAMAAEDVDKGPGREGQMEEAVVAVGEAVPGRRRRKGKRKAGESSEVQTSPSEVLRRRRQGRCRGLSTAELAPRFGGFATGNIKERLTPYTFTINAGQDVVSQILSFSKSGPQTICTILSATGIVSSATISQPNYPHNLTSFEGHFEIISLTGSFVYGEIIGGPEESGMFSITLGNSDGEVFGGELAGPLIAAGSIHVVCGGLE